VNGVRIKIVATRETKIKYVVAKATSITNLIKLVATINIGAVWVVVNNGGNNMVILV
jgi:hypothetical protein